MCGWEEKFIGDGKSPHAEPLQEDCASIKHKPHSHEVETLRGQKLETACGSLRPLKINYVQQQSSVLFCADAQIQTAVRLSHL